MFDKFTNGSKNLKLSVIEGFFASIMLTAGMSFVVPFALYLGANSIDIGFLNAFPALLGAWLQLFSIKLLEMYRSRKKLVIIFVCLQALTWVPIALLPFLPIGSKVSWMIVFYTAGVVFGAIPGPMWQSWMKSLVPSKILGTYFGFRTAIVGAFAFLILLAFGAVLNIFDTNIALIFGIIFGISVIGRLMSSFMFTKISDVSYGFHTEEDKTSFIDFVKQLRKTNFGYFVIYASMMTFAVSMLGPFFAMHLINTIKVDYLLYTVIIASSTLSSLLSMPYWGKLIDKYGTIKVLKATSLLACFFPLPLFFIRTGPPFIATEFLSGIVFSGFNLAIANFIYDASNQQKIIRFASFQAVFLGTATFFGLMVSGFIQNIPFSFGSLIPTAFYAVCLLSMALRLTTYKLLIGKVKEVKEVEHIHSKKIVFAVLTLTPVRELAFGHFFFFDSGFKGIGHGIKKSVMLGEKGLIKVKDDSVLVFKVMKTKSGIGLRVVKDGSLIGLKYIKMGSEFGLNFVKEGGGVGLRLMKTGEKTGIKVIKGSESVGMKVIKEGEEVFLDIVGIKDHKHTHVAVGQQMGLKVSKSRGKKVFVPVKEVHKNNLK